MGFANRSNVPLAAAAIEPGNGTGIIRLKVTSSSSLHTYYDSSNRRETAAALLVALYLLHETPQRVEQEAVARLLPPLTLGLP